jgi:hypothetical protein
VQGLELDHVDGFMVCCNPAAAGSLLSSHGPGPVCAVQAGSRAHAGILDVGFSGGYTLRTPVNWGMLAQVAADKHALLQQAKGQPTSMAVG